MTLTELGENIADKSFDTRPRFVRLTGERSGFIEFDFAIGEPDIHIEMILSEQAFKEFCENNNVTVLEPRAHHHEKVEDIGFEWRLSDATGRLKSKSTEKKSERTDMQIDMKTVAIEPQRKTFDHLKARFGDKVPSRYQEATYDLQVEENMHYRPTWDPEQNLYDKELSKIRMEDWYALKDPRQFYYSTYTLSRARQQEAMESNFKFVESRGLVALMSDELRATALDLLLPLRHENWSANLNNTFICGYGYGTAFTQPCMYHAVDNLGQAQYLSRLGLLLGGKQSLANAKKNG
nr:phenol hydroxylase subunit [Ponticaulis sp.]